MGKMKMKSNEAVVIRINEIMKKKFFGKEYLFIEHPI